MSYLHVVLQGREWNIMFKKAFFNIKNAKNFIEKHNKELRFKWKKTYPESALDMMIARNGFRIEKLSIEDYEEGLVVIKKRKSKKVLKKLGG